MASRSTATANVAGSISAASGGVHVVEVGQERPGHRIVGRMFADAFGRRPQAFAHLAAGGLLQVAEARVARGVGQPHHGRAAGGAARSHRGHRAERHGAGVGQDQLGDPSLGRGEIRLDLDDPLADAHGAEPTRRRPRNRGWRTWREGRGSPQAATARGARGSPSAPGAGSVMMPSTPRSSSSSISAGVVDGPHVDLQPEAWAVRTNRASVTMRPRNRWGTCTHGDGRRRRGRP